MKIHHFLTPAIAALQLFLVSSVAFSDPPHKNTFLPYTEALEKGDALSLAHCYYHGEGVEKNLTEAFKWFQKAAEQGLAPAQNDLGICYNHGEGIERNLTEAFKWWQKAAEQGCASAQENLGYCYRNGEGVAQNLDEAIKWFRKAAAQEDAKLHPNAAPQANATVQHEPENAGQKTIITLGTNTLSAQIAADNASRELGLRQRTNLQPNEAMIFVFPQPHHVSFWMKDTPLPLSVAYVDLSGRIMELHDLKPYDETPVPSASSTIVYAIEVTQGWFRKHGVAEGEVINGLPASSIAK